MTADDFRGLLELDKIVSDLFRWRDRETQKDITFERVEKNKADFDRGRFTPYSVCNGTLALTSKWMRERGWRLEEWKPLFRKFGAKCDCTVSKNVFGVIDEYVTVFHCRRCGEYRLTQNRLSDTERERRLSKGPPGHAHDWHPLRPWEEGGEPET